MKLSKILILSLGMALCAAGGIGVALAEVTKTPATSSSTSKYDKAIYLYWGHESETATLADMEAEETAQYRYLEVSPKSSKTLTGTVTVTFTLAPEAVVGKTAVTKGITVRVLELDAAATSVDFETFVSTGTEKCVINSATGETATGNATFTIAADSAVHETVKKYAIEVVWAPAGVTASEQVSATLTISQSFLAA